MLLKIVNSKLTNQSKYRFCFIKGAYCRSLLERFCQRYNDKVLELNGISMVYLLKHS